MKNLILVGSSIVLLTGCGAIGTTGNSTDHVTQDQYDPAQCTTLLPTTGRAALMSNLNVSNPEESAYFGKRYNRAMLEGVLDASGIETQKFVTALGINLSKIPTADGGCLFQHDLPVAGGALFKEWIDTAGGSHGGGHLDGLFVAYTDGVHSETQQAIMVREDSSRWTLVHEMMHANFFRQRDLDGVPGSSELRAQLKVNYVDLKSEYDSYKASPNEADAAKLEADTLAIAQTLYQSLVSGSLEEIADESLLLEEWSAGRLKNVSKSSAKNAAWYIGYSRDLSLTDLNNFSMTIGQIRDLVVANPPESVDPATFKDDANAAFDKSLTFIVSVNAQTAKIAQLAKDRIMGLTSAPVYASGFNIAFVEMTNAHIAAQNNTPELSEFRRQNAAFLDAVSTH